jgi:ribonuclease HI
MKSYKLYIDGSSIGNPGPGGGAFILENPVGKVIEEGWKSFGRVTSNEAEYLALIMGLEAAQKRNIKEIVVITDSELLYYQILGKYRLKASNLVPLFEKAKELLSNFDWGIKRVKRGENRRADQLAFIAASKGVKEDEKGNH